LGDAARAENGDLRQRAAHHRYFVTGIEARAGLAVFIDLVGERGAVDDAEAEVEEEVGNAGEEADGCDFLFFGLFEKSAEETAACALALGFGLHDDGADFGEVRPVEVEGSATEEDAACACVTVDGRFGYGEVADVFADLGVVAAEEGAVAGEGVDEVKDGDGVGELGFTHGGAAYAEAG
jgi:hypothetical protein